MKEKFASGGDGRSGSLLLQIYYIGRFALGEMGQGEEKSMLCKSLKLNRMAERGGFEPPVGVLAPTTV
jgi:hypothetical protein